MRDRVGGQELARYFERRLQQAGLVDQGYSKPNGFGRKLLEYVRAGMPDPSEEADGDGDSSDK